LQTKISEFGKYKIGDRIKTKIILIKKKDSKDDEEEKEDN